jgi:ribonuclease P/MRP protein subunit POP1
MDSPQKIFPKRTVFIRIHPSGFVQLWKLLLQLSKVQKPSVTVHDLRYEIGSLELMGPNSTESLVNILRPMVGSKESQKTPSADAAWDSLALITNPSFLPKNILIAFDAVDPRLRDAGCIKPNPNGMPQAIDVCSQWPLDGAFGPGSLFDRKLREKSNSSAPSEKTLNRKSETDPSKSSTSSTEGAVIPLVLFPTQQGRSIQSSWVVLLPWNRVKAVWRGFMNCPLSCGNTVRFGGIAEAHQAAYESGTAWFPADYPGTEAGFQWELQERKKSESEWRRKPKGRRVEYESVDLGAGRKGEIGRGWACDWESLVLASPGIYFSYCANKLTS